MGEKRKPILIMLLRIPGKIKTNKLEVFKATLFDSARYNPRCCVMNLDCRYRLRLNGKWWPKPINEDGTPYFFTKTSIKELLFKSIKL